MAQLLHDGEAFDANEVDPQATLEPVPAGTYKAMIVDSEMKATKSGSGEYLQLTVKVIEGPYENRRIFDRLNLYNQNDEAAKIAWSQLSAVCHAVNVLKLSDSVELHDKPFQITVAVREDAQYGKQNDVKGYSALNGGSAPASAAPPVANAAKPPANDASVPVWKRGKK